MVTTSASAAIRPSVIMHHPSELAGDLASCARLTWPWLRKKGQRDITWILLIPSLAAAHATTVIRPVEPAQLVPFTLQWNPSRAHTTAVARFVHAALTAELPPGWHAQPDHLHHRE